MPTDTVTDFNSHLQKAAAYHAKAEWELKLRELYHAKALCESKGFPDAARSRQKVLAELGSVERRLGRYDVAARLLQDELADDARPDAHRLTVLGELATVHRLMDDLQKAKEACQTQFDLAKGLSFTAEAEMCRAIGNLGMTNYQLSQEQRDHQLLLLATQQLHERVDRAAKLQERLQEEASLDSDFLEKARTWQSTGYDRLTLCYAANNNTLKAVQIGAISREMTRSSPDPTVRALSRFFYGYALLRNGQRNEAMVHWSFHTPEDMCTSVIALCKEPSQENCEYLLILVCEGVDLDKYDEQGYTALDYAIFSGDRHAKQAEAILLQGFDRVLPSTEVEERRQNAMMRKHYREVFQDHLRPVLNEGRSTCIAHMRQKYAELLSRDKVKRSMFDSFKFVPYTTFKAHGNIPHSKDGLVQQYKNPESNKKEGALARFVIFISYRWIGRLDTPPIEGPDDSGHTQYRRMLDAIEGFLEKHDDLTEDDIDIWLVSICEL